MSSRTFPAMEANNTWTGTNAFKNLNSIRLADQFATIQAAVDDLPSGGGYVLLTPNKTYALTGGVTTGSKAVHFVGGGRTTIVTGTGFALFTLASPGSTIEDLALNDPMGNAATIGVLIDNGTTGVDNWVLRNVYGLGSGLGVGIKTVFGLKGQVLGGEWYNWNKAVSLTGADASHLSNANHFSGVKIRGSATGVSIPAAGIDDVFFDGCTIEGNTTGIDAASGKVCISNSHLENDGSATAGSKNIKLNGASLSSISNFYAGAPANGDIDTANAGFILSVGDTLNAGVNHNGTGEMLIIEPTNTVPSATGTGKLVTQTMRQINGTRASSQNYVINGFNAVDLQSPLQDNSGDDLRLVAPNGKKIRFNDYTVTEKASVDGTGKGTFATALLTAATPTTAAGEVGLGTTVGFGDGTAGQAVTTTLKGTGSGPTTSTTVIKYLKVSIAGSDYYIPLMQ